MTVNNPLRWLLARLHDCPVPGAPVVEDQRVWTCPDCQRRWRWDVLPGGVGWVRE